MSLPERNRGNNQIIESQSGISIVIEQVFNAGNLIFLALEQLRNLQIPRSGTDDCFARSKFFAKLHEIQRILSRCSDQLVDVEQQNVFPYAVFDSSAFISPPEDLVLDFFVQSGKICANVYLISPAYHQSPSHNRQKSIGSTAGTGSILPGNQSTPTLTGSHTPTTPAATTYFFYNGAPVEIVYSARLEALLPSIITAMSSVETARGLLEDLCSKIELIQSAS